MFFAFVLMVLVFNLLQKVSPRRVDKLFRPGQMMSSALLSYAHGGNDAQKTIGIIIGLLVSLKENFRGKTGIEGFLFVEDASHIPAWVKFTAFTCISLGTLFGGWRIVHTMGSRITRLRPVGGFCAEAAGAIVIHGATVLGIPVSTTHTITGAIVGVGATNRVSAVRWGLAGRIIWAWIITIPASATIAAISFLILNALIKL